MKSLLLFILALISCLVLPVAMTQAKAQSSTPKPISITIDETDSLRYADLDNLIRRIYQYQQTLMRRNNEAGRFKLHTYTYGTSHNQQQGLASRILPHLIPFQSNPETDLGFEAFGDIGYQWPGEMQSSTVMFSASNRRQGRRIYKELSKALLPAYTHIRLEKRGSHKSFVLPLYDMGISKYSYHYVPVNDSLLQQAQTYGLDIDTTNLCCIGFRPIHHHHTLLEGVVLVDSTSLDIKIMQCRGRVDMARFNGTFYLRPNSLIGESSVPYFSDIDLNYSYLRSRGHNSYHTLYKYVDFLPFDSLDRHNIPRDLTAYYQKEPELADGFASIRPWPLPSHIDSLIYHSRSPRKRSSSAKSFKVNPILENIGETLIDGTNISSEQYRLRIYGPLDPASLGYDKFNGFTLRERFRMNNYFSNGRYYFLNGEIGYAFKLKELRWKLQTVWNFLPARRGMLRLYTQRSTSTFSSRFIQTINDALASDPNKVNFDSLGLDYFQRYEVDLCLSIELTNGLMMHGGILTIHRRPVQHGVRKATAERREELIDYRYGDFSPYIRFEYTPQQYYWYNEGRKEYINSPAPTMTLEIARAIPGTFNTQSNYGRAEFDIHQLIRIARTRHIAYHAGFGKFFNRKGEYFINYRYFDRSQYPETWEDDRIGGTFHLLADYWYSSSPSYAQIHFMRETPFGIAHLMPLVSRYVIKERLYLGTLWAEGKSLYNEFGYGIANNYFNLGMFVGFKDAKYYGFGVKFRIEIDRHL